MSDGADWWQQQQLLEQEQWEEQERINNGNRHYGAWRVRNGKKYIIKKFRPTKYTSNPVFAKTLAISQPRLEALHKG